MFGKLNVIRSKNNQLIAYRGIKPENCVFKLLLKLIFNISIFSPRSHPIKPRVVVRELNFEGIGL